MLLLGYHTAHEHKVLLRVVINMLFQSKAISLEPASSIFERTAHAQYGTLVLKVQI
jgi:predicted HTH domain antitoxin